MLKLALLVVFTCVLQLGYSQKNVHLKINHLLGTNTFALNQTATNTLGESFEATRLQYYISGITLHHDGTQTALPNTYLFVDAATNTDEVLGAFNITTLDSITIAIGVDSTSNHADPTSYASNHPLAPKNPSMHWSWSSGYRFVAFEGKTGASSSIFQIHALGDANYLTQTIVTSGQTVGNDINIVLDADYTEILRGITLAGLNSHGSTGPVETALMNFSKYVYSVPTTTSITDIPTTQLSMYPNPVKVGEAMQIETATNEGVQVQVYNLLGKAVNNVTYNSAAKTVAFPNAGFYIVQVLQNNKIIATRRVQVRG